MDKSRLVPCTAALLAYSRVNRVIRSSRHRVDIDGQKPRRFFYEPYYGACGPGWRGRRRCAWRGVAWLGVVRSPPRQALASPPIIEFGLESLTGLDWRAYPAADRCCAR